MTAILSIILLLHLAIVVYCIIQVSSKHFSGNTDMASEADLPFVSVLVAARNEEENIIDCLESLSQLNYPKDKFEVLIGNDDSTDRTGDIAMDFLQNKPNFKLINITQNLGKAKGKANVLAQLAREAKGEYFFITDADMQVPKNWIQSHLKHFSGDVYMSSGTTLSKSANSLFSKLQNLEWIYMMGLFNAVDKIKPVTAMGNNMAFKADKYFETGGYENLNFSVTEDIQLMKEFSKKGFKHKHILDAENLSFQKPLHSVNQLLEQRKRWFRGGKDQPIYILLLFLVYAAFFPVLLILFFFNWQISIYILAGKCFIDALFISAVSNRIKVKPNLILLPVYEIYQFVINPLILIFSLLTKKVNWKERKY